MLLATLAALISLRAPNRIIQKHAQHRDNNMWHATCSDLACSSATVALETDSSSSARDCSLEMLPPAVLGAWPAPAGLVQHSGLSFST